MLDSFSICAPSRAAAAAAAAADTSVGAVGAFAAAAVRGMPVDDWVLFLPMLLRRRACHCLQCVEDAGLPCTEMHPARIRGGLSLRQTAAKACVSVALDGSSDHDA